MTGKVDKRMHGPAQVSGVAATKYTVPANRRGIVRHIHIANPGAAVTFTMSIGADVAGTRIFDAVTIPANSANDYFCKYVLEAAEIIQAFASVASQLVLTIDGDEVVLS
jgi:hypothetical protein